MENEIIAELQRDAAAIGMTVAELCRAAGIGVQTFYDWKRQPGMERGKAVKAMRQAIADRKNAAA